MYFYKRFMWFKQINLFLANDHGVREFLWIIFCSDGPERVVLSGPESSQPRTWVNTLVSFATSISCQLLTLLIIMITMITMITIIMLTKITRLSSSAAAVQAIQRLSWNGKHMKLIFLTRELLGLRWMILTTHHYCAAQKWTPCLYDLKREAYDAHDANTKKATAMNDYQNGDRYIQIQIRMETDKCKSRFKWAVHANKSSWYTWNQWMIVVMSRNGH